MPHSGTPERPVVLQVQAELALDPADFAHIDEIDAEDLKHRMYELIEATVPVRLKRGAYTVRGTIRFVSPTPYQLKLARLAAEREA